MEYFISGNVPSSKNSKVATARGVFHSKAVKKYLQEKGVQHYSASRKEVKEYKTRPNLFKREIQAMRQELAKYKPPYKIGFYFVRKTRTKFDFHNLIQIILDLMTAHDIIEDDNCNVVLPYPVLDEKGMCYKVDKNNPGIYIKIMEDNERL